MLHDIKVFHDNTVDIFIPPSGCYLLGLRYLSLRNPPVHNWIGGYPVSPPEIDKGYLMAYARFVLYLALPYNHLAPQVRTTHI